MRIWKEALSLLVISSLVVEPILRESYTYRNARNSINPSIQRNKKKTTSCHIIIKLFKISAKKEILKGSQE